MSYLSFPRGFVEIFLKLARFIFVCIGIFRLCSLPGYIRPFLRKVTVHLQPFFGFAVGIWYNSFDRAFGLTNSAVDAFIGMNYQHVGTYVKTIDRADFDTVHVFAPDAVFCDDIGH